MSTTAGKQEQGISPENLLPLDAPELAAWIVVDELLLCHVFRRIRQADWETYFASGAAESASGNQIASTDADALALYRSAILRVDGYEGDDGRRPEDLPSWPECIPQDHRLAAIDALRRIFWTFAADSIATDKGRVSFEIISTDGKPGPFVRYFSAVHHFRAPTAEQRERFLRARTRYTVLVSLYDELIEGVEGYSVDGRAITGRDQIAREMDTYHKSIAAELLLDPHAPWRTQEVPVAATSGAVGPETAAGMARGKLVN